MSAMLEIPEIIDQQRRFYANHSTLDISFRLQQMDALNQALHRYEKSLSDALWKDLHKSYEEAYLTEFGIVYGEIAYHKKHLRAWAKDEYYLSPMSVWPGRTKVVKEPLGQALIIAPWNYPVQLLLSPLIGAISAGCTAMLKPSPYVPNVSAVLNEMIRETFPQEYIALVEGHRDINQLLLEQRWDMIFFTGSPALAKHVMAAAAKYLTPCVLELGGKSPCIIDKDADIEVAAKRVAWGKLLNAGQTCIAPDYILVQEGVKNAFLCALKQAFAQLIGEDAYQAKDYVRIVSEKAMTRLKGYLTDGTIYYGGEIRENERYFSPTILTDVSPCSNVMQEEIFGPIFPVLTFNTLDEALEFVNQREKPLALYYYGNSGKKVIRHTSSGGACINDDIMHIVSHRVPFGGVGNSGMNAYHGKASYLCFSHRRTVVSTPTCIDVPFRYMPYKLFKWMKKLV